MKRSRIVYIEANQSGNPCMQLGELLVDAFERVFHHNWWLTGITNRPGKNRRKVRVTVTVEAIE